MATQYLLAITSTDGDHDDIVSAGTYVGPYASKALVTEMAEEIWDNLDASDPGLYEVDVVEVQQVEPVTSVGEILKLVRG